MRNVASPLPPLCEDTESNPLLDLVPDRMRGPVNSWFVTEARKGSTEEQIVEAVLERLSVRPEYADLLATMTEHPDATAAQARHALAHIALSEEERRARKQIQQNAAIAQRMASQPPSAKQLSYLRSLGYNGPIPATMQEAHNRIATLLKGNRV